MIHDGHFFGIIQLLIAALLFVNASWIPLPILGFLAFMLLISALLDIYHANGIFFAIIQLVIVVVLALGIWGLPWIVMIFFVVTLLISAVMDLFYI